MKKLLYIIIFVFLLVGSNNYQELNKIAIITNISIEKDKDNFKVTFQEIIPKKEESKISKTYNYYTNTSDKLENAFYNLPEDITKEVYLEHLENIIIKSDDLSIIYKIEKLLKNDLDNFNIILCEDNPIDILKYSNNYKYINSLIKDNTTLRSIKKAKLEKKSIKLPIVRIKDKKLEFYKYKELGDIKNA